MRDEELCDLPALEHRRLIRDGELSSRELLDCLLRRIEDVNPVVNAIVTLDPDGARAEAAAADEAQARGQELGPLHGLVVAHKDLLATRGMRTTLGSRLLQDDVPSQDAALARRIRQAGAVRVGKTNVPEFGFGSHTFNAVFGVTRNPYAPARSSGGSSGGAAAALAAGMVSLADGGDMGGSLRNPASFCNVVGLRPPIGRVTTAPVRTGWPGLAVLGPMGRTVRDVALFHGAIAGFDADDPQSLPGDGGEFLALADTAPPESLAGVRVGWSADLGGVPVDPAVTEIIETAGAGTFEALGARRVGWEADFAGAERAFLAIRGWAVAGLLREAYATQPDLLSANARDNTEEGLRVTAEDLFLAAVAQQDIRARVLAQFAHVDVLATPTAQVPPFPAEWDWPHEIAGVGFDHYLSWMKSCWYITLTGLPAISVPCGFTPEGLPVGIQLVGRPCGEVELLRVAAAFEHANAAGRRRPDLQAVASWAGEASSDACVTRS